MAVTPLKTRSVVYGVLFLSAGTFTVQVMSAVGQLVLAFWLTPVDYGYWAMATSVLAVVTGLVNLGEVSGYLSTPSASYRQASKSILRINSLLALVGLALGAIYYGRGQEFVALLIALCALNLPLLGEHNLLYARYVKSGQRTRLVMAQFVGATGRLVVGVLVAWTTSSAIAFASSMLAYSVITVGILRFVRPHENEVVETADARAPLRQRLPWAAQSSAQMLAGQVDYLVVSFVSTPQMLGIYFFSYQVTIGLSAVLSGPLSKSALSELASEVAGRRQKLAAQLVAYTAGGVGLVCAVGALLLFFLGGFLPGEWHSAVAVIVILLGSLPARFVTPITDALQMADGRWWRSTSLNTVDTIGTALAALVATTGQVLWLATAIVCWKVLFSLVRYVVALPSVSLLGRSGVAAYLVGFVCSMAAGGFDPDRFAVAGPALALCMSGGLLLSSNKESRGRFAREPEEARKRKEARKR